MRRKHAGWTDDIGADADHLKVPQDVDVTAAVGFTFFTIDPSDDVDQKADDYDEATLRGEVLRRPRRRPLVRQLPRQNRSSLDTGTVIELRRSRPACGRRSNTAKRLRGR